MLDVVPPEKIPGRVVPRVGVRDCVASAAAGVSAGAGGATGTDPAPSFRKTHGEAGDSVRKRSGGGGGDGDDSKASKGRGAQDESAKEGAGGSSGGGAGAGGGGEEETAAEKTGRGRRSARKSGAAGRKKRGSRSERFFEVSATSQVREHCLFFWYCFYDQQLSSCRRWQCCFLRHWSADLAAGGRLQHSRFFLLKVRADHSHSATPCASMRPRQSGPLLPLPPLRNDPWACCRTLACIRLAQPPFVDSLDLQAGVCVKEGGDERQGPAFEEAQVGEGKTRHRVTMVGRGGGCLFGTSHSRSFGR